MNKILFLGPEGSYSYHVALEVQKMLPNYTLCAAKDFQTIHNEVLNDKNVVGVLPFENSITTIVYENVDFVFDKMPNIIGEIHLPIVLNLIGKKNSNSDVLDGCDIYSQYKALSQCSNFIAKNHLNAIKCNSTSEGQKLILDKDNCYAISGDVIDDSLEVKKANIGNYTNNKTRFIIVSNGDKKLYTKQDCNKISFWCKLLHKEGSLARLLDAILEEGINMTKIESKPIPDSDFEYSFVIEGLKKNSIEENKIKSILDKNTLENKILGVYKCQ